MQRFIPQLSAALPQDWFAKESITLLAPDGAANVIASSEPLDPSVDAQNYAEVQGKLLREEFPGYREYVFEQTPMLGGKRGWIRRFEWTPPDGVPVTQIQIYYAEAGRGYTATATATRESFERFEMLFRQILGGLKLNEGAVAAV